MKVTQNVFLPLSQIPQIFSGVCVCVGGLAPPRSIGTHQQASPLCSWQVSKTTPGPLHSTVPLPGRSFLFSHRPTRPCSFTPLLTPHAHLMPHPNRQHSAPAPFLLACLPFLLTARTLHSHPTPQSVVGPLCPEPTFLSTSTHLPPLGTSLAPKGVTIRERRK